MSVRGTLKWSALAAALAAAAALACGEEPGGGKLTLTAAVTDAPADGTWLLVDVAARDEFDQPGQGEVTLTLTHGKLRGFGRSALIQLKDGKASIEVSCEEAQDFQCPGGQVVRANWSGLDAYLELQFDSLTADQPDGGQ